MLNVLVATNEELHIHIKLNGEYSVGFEFSANLILSKKIDSVLRDAHLGSITGSEAGGGFESLFCEGPDAIAMYTVVRAVIPKWPDHSFAELFSDGTKSRLELQR